MARWSRCVTKSSAATSSKSSRRKGHKPSRDWLSFVKSSHARSKIAIGSTCRSAKKPPTWAAACWKKKRAQFGRSLKKIPEADLMKVASDSGLSKLDDLYAAVGFGKYSARQILTRVLGEPEKGSRADSRGVHADAGQDRQAHAGLWRGAARRQRPRRSARLSREVLQSDSRRRHHRLHHARPRRRGTHAHVPQCAKSCCIRPNGASLSNGAAKARRKIPRAFADSRARSRRIACRYHRRHSATPAATFTISKAVPTGSTRKSTPISKSSIAASSSPSSPTSGKIPASTASNACTRRKQYDLYVRPMLLTAHFPPL